MDRRSFLSCATAAIAVSLNRIALAEEPAVQDLGELVEAIRKEHELPGIAAAAVKGERMVAEGVAGLRRLGKDDKITLDNRFALASCTKRMTAAMIGRVVDSGKLSFDTTLAEALPATAMRDDYKSVTVAQLLTHTGGLPSYLQIGPDLTPNLFALQGTPAEQREQFIRLVLQEEPIVKPGTEPRYSNAGYGLVGYVAEQRTGRSWETLMLDEVFGPLGMQTAGFGRPWSKDWPDEPLLHQKGEQGYEPEAEDRANPMEAFAPAGNAHCSIRDFAKFAAYELNAARGNNSLLKPETAKRMQELSGGPLGGGRGKLGPKTKTGSGPKGKGGPGAKVTAGPDAEKRPAGSGRPFFGGSAFVSAGCILWPDQNLAVVAMVNAGGANEAIRAAFEQVRQRVAGM